MVTKNRVYGLDLMRSVAMLCVIVTHSGYGSLFGTRYGIVAVESFFVVSGFLIGGILLRDFKDEILLITPYIITALSLQKSKIKRPE